MPSPDFSQYVDLTIYDKSPGQIYLDSINYAQTVALPEFNPRAGSIEDGLLQAVSYATSELAGAINRLPDGLLEGILNLYGFTRQQSISARLNLEISLIDTSGGTVPAGALFSYTTEGDNGLETYFFATVADLVIADGDSTGIIEVEALTVGVIPTIASGTQLTPVSGVSRVLYAYTSGEMTQGEDEETDFSYFTRAAAFLASRSDSLATSTQMQNYLTTYSNEIYRAYVSDLTLFKYIRAESITRTGADVTVTLTGIPDLATTKYSNITLTPDDVTAGVTRVICRYVDDSGTSDKINGTKLSTAAYIVDTFSYDSGTGVLSLTFKTPTVSTDSAVTYLPTSTAPHDHHDVSDAVPNSHVIEILLTPDDYNEQNGAVGLVFGTSAGIPIQSSAYYTVQEAVANKSVAGLQFSSIAPIIVPITISAEVQHAPTYGAVAVRTAVETALANYLSPSNWIFGKNVYVNSLIGIAAGVAGVARIASLTLSVGTTQFSDLATYNSADGGYVEFAYPFCLPAADITISGISV